MWLAIAVCGFLIASESPAQAEGACVDTLYAAAEGTTIRVYHDGATYNCCPVFGYEVDVVADRIVIRELEIESWCNCICCMDLDVVVEDVPPGSFTVEFHWFDYETAEWQAWELDVSVEDLGQGAIEPALGVSRNSECYDPTTGVGQHSPETWTMIKIRYR